MLKQFQRAFSTISGIKCRAISFTNNRKFVQRKLHVFSLHLTAGEKMGWYKEVQSYS